MSNLWFDSGFSTKTSSSKPSSSSIGQRQIVPSSFPSSSKLIGERQSRAASNFNSDHSSRKRALSPHFKVPALPKKLSINDFEPKSCSDLAISRQKLTELRNWFTERFANGISHRRGSPLLLLNGPAGSGKTISVKVLCKEFNIDLIELTSSSTFKQNDSLHEALGDLSIDHDRRSMHLDEPVDRIKSVCAESQQTRFRRFLHDLNFCQRKLVSDDIETAKLLLIEDVPQIFHLQPNLLHEELGKICEKYGPKTVPIVFILSETANDQSVEQTILPKSVQIKLNFNVITFRPITNASLTKAISNTTLCKHWTKQEIEEVVIAASNDIRNAFNYLIFKHSRLTNRTSSTSSNSKKAKLFNSKIKVPKRTVSSDDDNRSMMVLQSGREEHLSLMHAIGKILYAKRLPVQDPEISRFITRFPHVDRRLQRNPLNEQRPEEIAERAHANCDTLLGWMFENYHDFIEADALDNAIECLEVLAISDSHFRNFESKNVIEEIRTSYLIRGEMYAINRDASSYLHEDESNTRRKANLTFRPLRGPPFKQQRNDAAKCGAKLSVLKNCALFGSRICESDRNLVLDILPFARSITALRNRLDKLNLSSFANDFCDPSFSAHSAATFNWNVKTTNNFESNFELSTAADEIVSYTIEDDSD